MAGKCPFCGSKDIIDRGKVVVSTKKKLWKNPVEKKPWKGHYCNNCKQVFRDPA